MIRWPIKPDRWLGFKAYRNVGAAVPVRTLFSLQHHNSKGGLLAPDY